MVIRPLPYFAAFVISSLTMKPSGIAVGGQQIEFNTLDEDLLRAIVRCQHRREVATEILKEFPEFDDLHAVVGMQTMMDSRNHGNALAATASCAAAPRCRCPALQRNS